jgi:hypothetical protein
MKSCKRGVYNTFHGFGNVNVLFASMHHDKQIQKHALIQYVRLNGDERGGRRAAAQCATKFTGSE